MFPIPNCSLVKNLRKQTTIPDHTVSLVRLECEVHVNSGHQIPEDFVLDWWRKDTRMETKQKGEILYEVALPV